MGYVTVYVLALILPGWAILASSTITWKLRLPLIVMVSYAIFLVCVFLAFAVGTTYQVMIYGWVVAAAICSSWGIWRNAQSVLRGRSTSPFPEIKFNAQMGVFLATVVSVLLYLLWAGPYLELPSDSWWHLGRMQDKLEAIQDGATFTELRFTEYFNKDRGYWYLLHAGLTWLAGYDIQASISYVSTLNQLIFLISVYGFALYIFKKLDVSKTQLHLIASFSVAFFVLHFGISAFSYVRYYALAPAMLSYAIYLGMAGLLLSWLEEETQSLVTLALLILGVFVLSTVHKQELMFFVIAAAAMIAYLVLLSRRERSASWFEAGAFVSPNDNRRKVFLIFMGLICIYVVVHAYLYVSVGRHSVMRHARMIDMNSFVPYLKNLYILDPSKNFYATVTIWGSLIYLLYILRWGSLKKNIFVSSMMLVPFFTVFNPVFVDLFLRVSWSELLWRVSYMLPLPFLAAYFLVYYATRVKEGKGIIDRTLSMVPVLLLFVLLFPIQSRFVEAHEVRFPSLAKVHPENDQRNWSDLISFLKTQPKKTVLTDRITGYMINGTTYHIHQSHKFRGYRALPLNKTQYNRNNFKHMLGWWLVINLRDGGKSVTGRMSGHWPEDVLHLKHSYSVEFLTFVDSNKDLFKLVWDAPDIKIFEIVKG